MEIRNIQRKETIDRDLVARAARAALLAAGLGDREVSVAVVGDRAMAALNRRWTGRRGPTDVLSFPLEEGRYLGEVVVSAGRCRRQAVERGATFEDELAALVVHGVVHLAGHDHTLGPREARRQQALESRALGLLSRGGSR